MPISTTVTAFVLAAVALSVQAKQHFTWGHLPHQWEQGQSGYNDCGTTDTPTAKCQTLIVNSVDDFCLWGAAKGYPGVGDAERDMVSWCTKAGHGSRLMPPGTITGAHFVSTDNYIQLTGRANLKNINLNGYKDGGGELDPHGADGLGNPIGSLLFSTALQPGSSVPVQAMEWHMFLEEDRFCLKACRPSDNNAAADCPHIYDEQGCDFNDPGNYNTGFDTCDGEVQQPPGVYGQSTWYQGQQPTPSAHPAGAKSNCVQTATIQYGSYGTKIVTSSKPTKTPHTKTTHTKHTKATKATKTQTPSTKTAEPKKPKHHAKKHTKHTKKHTKRDSEDSLFA